MTESTKKEQSKTKGWELEVMRHRIAEAEKSSKLAGRYSFFTSRLEPLQFP